MEGGRTLSACLFVMKSQVLLSFVRFVKSNERISGLELISQAYATTVGTKEMIKPVLST